MIRHWKQGNFKPLPYTHYTNNGLTIWKEQILSAPKKIGYGNGKLVDEYQIGPKFCLREYKVLMVNSID